MIRIVSKGTLSPVGVDNGYHQLFADESDGMPPFLAVLYPLHEREAIRIVEDELGAVSNPSRYSFRLPSFFTVSHSSLTIP